MNDSMATQTNGIADAPPAGDQSIFALLAAAHGLEAKVEAALDHAGISSPKFAVLSALVAAGHPLSLSDLAAKLSCVRSNMTQLVDRLEAEGLVQRVHCPNDRRSVKAEITYAGRDRHRAGEAEVAKLHAEFTARVTPDDRAALVRLLSALK